jgi:CRISPR-associated exonuclease Cas4
MNSDDYIMISSLQHLVFCERQFALIHIEQQWAENRFTAQGDLVHQRVDTGPDEKRKDVIMARSVRLNHPNLGLTGIADLVEFQKVAEGEQGTPLPHRRGLWNPVPVEYKRGKPKIDDCDRVQLCAQILCLEKMYGLSLTQGALWYNEVKHREWVEITQSLREETIHFIHRAHQMIQEGVTPSPVYEKKKCTSCSLFDICRPKDYESTRLKRYYRSLFEVEEE